MKRFSLTYAFRGEIPKVYQILVDAEDAHLVRAHSWRIHTAPGGLFYPCREHGSYRCLHHDVLNTQARVYHINGNGLDCRRENLSLRRPVEHAEFSSFMRYITHASNFSPALAS